MQDLLAIMRELTALIRANQTEAAAEKVEQALKKQSDDVYKVRTLAITQINNELQKMKRDHDCLEQAVQALPEKERLFAEQQIESVVDKLYTNEMAALRHEKRKLSRPGR